MTTYSGVLEEMLQARLDAEGAFRRSLCDKLQQDIADRPFWKVAWNTIARPFR